MKRQLVRLVSHEIRTPLSTVKVGLELVEKRIRQGYIIGEELLDILDDSRQSCDSAIAILNDLLNYEKLDAGIMALERTEFAALSLIEETMRPFLSQVPRVEHLNHCVCVCIFNSYDSFTCFAV